MRLFIAISLIVFIQTETFSQDFLLSKKQEKFIYKINYGWISIGEAELTHQVQDSTLDISVLAYTTGIINWIARLRDSLHTNMIMQTLKPITTFQDRKEGRYNRKETDYFDFEEDSARIIVYKKRKNEDEVVESRMVHLKDSTFDMLSGYAYLREYNWHSCLPGDSVMFNMFYEGKYYDFGIEYIEKTEVETAMGSYPAHLGYILFPLSGTFPEKHMVKVWVSADDKKWPLQIEAQMKFGKAVCELVQVQ